VTVRTVVWARNPALIVLVVTLAACGLPRSGPSKRELTDQPANSVQASGSAYIVQVDSRVSQLTKDTNPLGFSQAFRRAQAVGSDEIHAGDVLSVQIWENVDQGLFTIKGAAAPPLPDMQVDGTGFIFVPYAGRIRAAGNSPDELRRIITTKLAEQTPDPQVSVVRKAGDGATVSVVGDISAQGVYPIERPTRMLSAMVAHAGGVKVPTEIAQVTVTRGKMSGKVWLKDLYNNPAADVPLRPGDVVLVQADPRAYTAIGATGQQQRIQFDAQTITAVEALAQVGGLQSATADPTGVFVLRDEKPAIANAVLGRHDITKPQRVAYVLNLTEPDGLFNARDFLIRDGDTIYVTEAPYVRWQKTLSVLTGAAGSANQVAGATKGL